MRTTIASATVSVSPHAPSPTLNSRRLTGKLASATRLPAASRVSTTGMRDVAAHALHRQATGDFVPPATQVPDRAGAEPRDRELRGVEPERTLDLVLRIVAGEIDAAQVHLDVRFGARQRIGPEHHVRLEAAEAAVDIDAQLLRGETDLAAVEQHALPEGGGCRSPAERRRALQCGEQHASSSGSPRLQSRQHPREHLVAIDQVMPDAPQPHGLGPPRPA